MVTDICNYTAPGDPLLVTAKPADKGSPDVVKLQGFQLPNMSLDSNVQIVDAQGDSFIPVPTKTILIPMAKKRTAPTSTVTSQDVTSQDTERCQDADQTATHTTSSPIRNPDRERIRSRSPLYPRTLREDRRSRDDDTSFTSENG